MPCAGRIRRAICAARGSGAQLQHRDSAAERDRRSLHMGHAFQHTLMDALTRSASHGRRRRTLWQPGTDHAGHRHPDGRRAPAQQRRYVAARPRSRARSLQRVWEWKAESGGTHLAADAPARRVGGLVARTFHHGSQGCPPRSRKCSCACTMTDSSIAASVSSTGTRCCIPRCRISRSLAEPEPGHLWHLRYPLGGWIRSHRRGDHASGDHARRHRCRRASGATSAIGTLIGLTGAAAAHRAPDPDHRR